MNDFVRNEISRIAIDDLTIVKEEKWKNKYIELLNHIILERQLLYNLQGLNCDEE